MCVYECVCVWGRGGGGVILYIILVCNVDPNKYVKFISDIVACVLCLALVFITILLVFVLIL